MACTIVNQRELLEAVPALTLRQLRRLRAERKIPFLKVGHRSFLYDTNRVIEALRKLEISQ
jgi:hypothetical protein